MTFSCFELLFHYFPPLVPFPHWIWYKLSDLCKPFYSIGIFCSFESFLDNSLTPQSSLIIDLKFQCDLNTLFSNTFSTFIKTEKADVEIYMSLQLKRKTYKIQIHTIMFNSSTGIPLLSAEDTLFILLLGSIQSFRSVFFPRSFVKLLARIKPHDLKPYSQWLSILSSKS